MQPLTHPPGVGRFPAPSAQAGFTLIELMIAVAIVAILAAVAYPSYTEYVAKGRRARATADLMAAHQWMERFYTENFRYDQNAAGTATTSSALFPSRFSTSPAAGEGTAAYNLSLPALARESYTITATRTGSMAADGCGNFTINHLGVKSIAAGTFDTSKYADLGAAVRACWRQ